MLASSVLCRQSLKQLETDLAGQHGPVLEQDIRDVMCSSRCLLGDKMRTIAMNVSGCDCLELSTKPGQSGYKTPGDWCAESSGQQLCEELEECGEWTCALNDFHCERNEYNRLFVPLRGFGGECNSGIRMMQRTLLLASIFLLCVVLIAWY